MFCPNCGEKLETTGQRFCAYCGSEITPIENTYEINSNLEQETPSPTPQPPAETTQTPVPQYETIKQGESGPHSRKGLGFGIASLIIGIIGGYYGFIVTMISTIIQFSYPYPSPGIGAIIGVSIAIGINCLGLIFGIVSRKNSTLAEKLDGDNAVQKAGSVLGVLGIILNSILLVIGLFVLIL